MLLQSLSHCCLGVGTPYPGLQKLKRNERWRYRNYSHQNQGEMKKQKDEPSSY